MVVSLTLVGVAVVGDRWHAADESGRRQWGPVAPCRGAQRWGAPLRKATHTWPKSTRLPVVAGYLSAASCVMSPSLTAGGPSCCGVAIRPKQGWRSSGRGSSRPAAILAAGWLESRVGRYRPLRGHVDQERGGGAVGLQAERVPPNAATRPLSPMCPGALPGSDTPTPSPTDRCRLPSGGSAHTRAVTPRGRAPRAGVTADSVCRRPGGASRSGSASVAVFGRAVPGSDCGCDGLAAGRRRSVGRRSRRSRRG